MKRRVINHVESWASKRPFRIAKYRWNDYPSVVCQVEQDGVVGWGEALGVYYLDETESSMLRDLESVTAELERGADREKLKALLPPGGARNAADAALWDLEAQLNNTTVWEMAGVEPDPVLTNMTVGLEDEPQEMAAVAREAMEASLLKVKLDDDRPVERIEAVRNARPDVRLIVDVNQGWSFTDLKKFAPQLADLGVEMIEQPLPRGADAELEGYESPVALCADESCLHLDELGAVAGRYDIINIKLDKTGGLTHALELAAAIRERGLRIMVGSMCGSSLAMAPHHVVAQLAEYADIDGPLLMVNDRLGGLVYNNCMVSLPDKRFWGTP